MSLSSVVLILCSSVISAVGSLLFKKTSKVISRNIIKSVFNKYFLSGVSLYFVSSLVFIFALRGINLSVGYPIAATTYIWVSLLSVKYLGEEMNKMKWLGIVLIIFGITLIGAAS